MPVLWVVPRARYMSRCHSLCLRIRCRYCTVHWPVPLPWPPVSVPIPKAVSSVVPVTVGLPVHVTAFVYRPIPVPWPRSKTVS